jgi:K+-sensing histidine kinase KdpD
MLTRDRHAERTLEFSLVLITIGLTTLLWRATGHKLIVLNLFYLPVVLAGFFLGRYRAGVLALLSVVAASVVIVSDIAGFATISSPIVIGLSVTIWGSVLGLTALLVGTLCDDRAAKTVEAREAHVGVVEVLARYLQSANPGLQNRAARISHLSEQVARKMRLSEKEVNDIRVAALLMDMENLEITARVIKKAVGELEDYDASAQHTFHGTELVQSLGSVLTGAFPLLLTQSESGELATDRMPFGARIIRSVRAFDHLIHSVFGGTVISEEDAIQELSSDVDADYHPAVLHALAEVLQQERGEAAEPAASASQPQVPVSAS